MKLYKHLDANEEALLTFLWFHPRSLQDRVGAGNADPLWCCRTLQVQHISLSKLFPCRLQRVTDSEEDSAAHKERGFTYVRSICCRNARVDMRDYLPTPLDR